MCDLLDQSLGIEAEEGNSSIMLGLYRQLEGRLALSGCKNPWMA